MSQKGGAGKVSIVGGPLPGTTKTYKNGATGAKFNAVKADGGKTVVHRIIASTGASASAARDARANPKPITQAQAKKAYDRAYKPGAKIRRGPNKGAPRFKSDKGAMAAKTYDAGHTKNVIADSRYLKNPYKFDFAGVDAGNKVRKPRTDAQKAATKRLVARNKVMAGKTLSVDQLGGYWW